MIPMKTVLIFGAVAITLSLAGCSNSPSVSDKSPAPTKSAKSGGYYLDDGPDATPPPNLDAIPDAVPRAEPLNRFANRPYDVLGSSYVPQTERRAYSEEGVASWYGKRFHGKKTASGEPYDMYAMTAAHPTLPIPSYVRVTSLASGKSVVVRINDRGPFHSKRIIDLSYVAASKLGYVGNGSTRVRVESLDPAAYDMKGEAIKEGIYLQVGAFASSGNAQQLLARLTRELELDASQTRVVLTGKLHRVQLGPYSSDDAAQVERTRVQERLALNAIMVRRD
ncbi:MAG: rare lipoprotein [Proteobacteria bacterium]|jgi:rare lipoprotein A|nr:rare lipoprotein [Pseudomonadota bacterium]